MINEVERCFDDESGGSSGLSAALFRGGNYVGHDEDVVFIAEIAGGGSEDCFGADVEFAIAGEGHADVVFAEEFGDFDGWGEWVGSWIRSRRGFRWERLRG